MDSPSTDPSGLSNTILPYSEETKHIQLINQASPSKPNPLFPTSIELASLQTSDFTPSPIKIHNTHTIQSLSPCLYVFPYRSSKLIIYNIENNIKQELVFLDYTFLDHSAWSLAEGGKIINTGGYDGKSTDQVFVFNIDLKNIEKAKRMNSKRYKHAQIALGSFVYAIGGVSQKGRLKSVERLCLDSFKWKKIGQMNCQRENPGACSHEGKIYIAGGISLNTIEIFNPLNKKFTLMTIKLNMPGKCSMFSYDDCIIVLQGNQVSSCSWIEKMKVEHNEWINKGDSIIRSGVIYFVQLSDLFRLDLVSNSLDFVDKLY
ncbi:hypothetical protein SteCoe_1603 [Stentor coeruleus]|uniref:Kelch motif family protein n=1 Tax=Stentor coeruleus TaxID=5963 RepID=A0A1R2D1H1_9CILI|nr:hypothetical protein SteCoe_1603 [Stentor coeruleus]